MRKVFTALLFIALVLFPLFGIRAYYIRLVTMIFMWIALSECWNMMSGYTGYIDFGPVVYFGIGAYSTAILMVKYHFPFLASIVAGGIISFIISVVIGAVTLRIRGAYFAIATFAFAEAMREVVLEFDRTFNVSFFGGSHGITLPIGPGHRFFYYVYLAVMLMVVFATYIMERSKMGYGLRAIRESEDAARLCGVDTLRIKVLSYAISAFFIGVSGGINAYWLTYITPNDVFSVHITIQMVINTLLGGMGTVLGPIIGASFLTLVAEPLWAKFPYEYLIFLGVIILVVITMAPRGIVGLIEGWRRS